MNQLTVTVLQLGLLVALWLFVLGVVAVLRRDLFGTRAPAPAPASPPAAAASPPAPAPSVPAPAPPRPASQRPLAPPAAAAPAAPPVPRRLVVTEGQLAGTTVELTGEPVLMGRAPDCTLPLGDDYASGHHARLLRDGARWVLEDLGSTNGTSLGRGSAAVPVRGRVAVGVGSVVRIGRTTLELRA